ncbi:MAG: nuclear transport factor 2 family protein [Pseudomonadota bacterium]
MSTSRTIVFVIASLVSASVLAAEEDGRDAAFYKAAEEYIVECSRDWAETVVTGDRTKRRIYFADDFVGTSTDGYRYDKAAITKDTGPASYIVSNTLDHVEVRFYGDTAIALGEETWVKKDGSSGRYVWTDVWLYRNGEWQVVAAQDAAAPIEDD